MKRTNTKLGIEEYTKSRFRNLSRKEEKRKYGQDRYLNQITNFYYGKDISMSHVDVQKFKENYVEIRKIWCFEGTDLFT